MKGHNTKIFRMSDWRSKEKNSTRDSTLDKALDRADSLGPDLPLKDILDVKVHNILMESLKNGSLVRQARRYYVERKIDKISMDKAYTHLRMLTPDGMRPKGVYLNLAHHIAHVFRVQYGRGKIKSEYGAILRDILEAPEK